MSKCTCGRTFRPPFCDSTHWLSDEEYNTLAAKVKKNLREKKCPNYNTTYRPRQIT
jgi:CDGSH-type Zn-finger protein